MLFMLISFAFLTKREPSLQWNNYGFKQWVICHHLEIGGHSIPYKNLDILRNHNPRPRHVKGWQRLLGFWGRRFIYFTCLIWAQGGDFPQSLPVCVVKIWRVIFQSILAQEGHANMGIFLMSFSNIGTMFSIQFLYIISDTWTGLTS